MLRKMTNAERTIQKRTEQLKLLIGLLVANQQPELASKISTSFNNVDIQHDQQIGIIKHCDRTLPALKDRYAQESRNQHILRREGPKTRAEAIAAQEAALNEHSLVESIGKAGPKGGA